MIEHNDPNYEFQKEIKSNTKTRAIHFKYNKEHYHVAVGFYPKEYWKVSGYKANRSGQPKDFLKWEFLEKATASTLANDALDEDLEYGVNKLIQMIKDSGEE
jgi:hypothetical protein